MQAICKEDTRRDAVRANPLLNGLDYVESSDTPPALYVYFLGKLPTELTRNKPDIARHLRLTGGELIRDLKVVDVDADVEADPERDDCLIVTLDRAGDYSAYTLELIDLANIDPVYRSARFSFKVDCPSDLDCKKSCDCPPAVFDEPHIDYLAKDYTSFRQLLLDRFALTMPQWTERHEPDIQLTLVELLAYFGDYLSYYQDAVATEAYLNTARQRISVRRHLRLIDYLLHEGCNARAWLVVNPSSDLQLTAGDVAFITGLNEALANKPTILGVQDLEGISAELYEYFEPMLAQNAVVDLKVIRNEIHFYTWGQRECCLPKGSTRTTLLDAHSAAPANTATAANAPGRALGLKVGDVLVFEEIIGAKTGLPADADPTRRHAVRLTRVDAGQDSLYTVPFGGGETPQQLPTPLLEVEWADEDALPFAFCISTLGSAPGCRYLINVSVARGNVILVDHGRSLDPEPIGTVPEVDGEGCCDCADEPSEVVTTAGPFTPKLAHRPLTHRQPLSPTPAAASQTLSQDARAALPQLWLADDSGSTWIAKSDLLGSGGDDRNFVTEIDNDQIAHLRFGNGELGRLPDAGSTFTAAYRTGLGARGNVGAESITHLVLDSEKLDGVSIEIRNPLPAQGGTEAEPLAEARLYGPETFRTRLMRAITADDYAVLAAMNAKLQRASARLTWTGSWYEADVSIDPLHAESSSPELIHAVTHDLHRYRRMGHDMRVQQAVYVPIALTLEVCALPGYDRGHVKGALLDVFSNRQLANGSLGFFHPDRQTFGDDIEMSRIIGAAQAVRGVACVTVTQFQRQFEAPNHELEDGVLPLASSEIALLDNDPNHPERGYLLIIMSGGRG
jgi:hypothetical protein